MSRELRLRIINLV